MFLPSRKAKQRKPSHFGSYSHWSPSGISSTSKASIGRNGGLIGSVMMRQLSNVLGPTSNLQCSKSKFKVVQSVAQIEPPGRHDKIHAFDSDCLALLASWQLEIGLAFLIT